MCSVIFAFSFSTFFKVNRFSHCWNISAHLFRLDHNFCRIILQHSTPGFILLANIVTWHRWTFRFFHFFFKQTHLSNCLNFNFNLKQENGRKKTTTTNSQRNWRNVGGEVFCTHFSVCYKSGIGLLFFAVWLMEKLMRTFPIKFNLIHEALLEWSRKKL